MDEEEHEVYGGEIPMEAEMEADMENQAAPDEDAVKVHFYIVVSYHFYCEIEKTLISIGSDI